MSLLEDASEDLATATAQPLVYTDDPRGATYGKKWVASGATFICAYRQMSTRERFEAGMQQREKMVRLYANLTAGASPVNERQRVSLLGREYDVTSVQTIVALGDEGAIVEAVSA